MRRKNQEAKLRQGLCQYAVSDYRWFRSSFSHSLEDGRTAEWCIVLCDNNFGAWRSSVARLLWEQEVPGSNPGAPTTLMTMTYGIAHLLSVLSIPQIGTT